MKHFIKVLLGNINTQTGKAIILDPIELKNNYVDGDFCPDVYEAKNSYDKCCKIVLDPVKCYGQIANKKGIVLKTGKGEGNYPVYGLIDEEGKIMRVEIDFS